MPSEPDSGPSWARSAASARHRSGLDGLPCPLRLQSRSAAGNGRAAAVRPRTSDPAPVVGRAQCGCRVGGRLSWAAPTRRDLRRYDRVTHVIVSAGKALDRTPLLAVRRLAQAASERRTSRRHLALSHDGGIVAVTAVAERTAHIPGIAA